MKKTCGIYLITCTKPDGSKVYYVGQSINIERRIDQHRGALKSGRHSNQIMQRLWLKYGGAAFSFDTLEECRQALLGDHENWWLGEMVGRRRCMNIGTKAGAPMAGVKFSKEHRDKIRAAHSGSKHYLYGKEMPAETKARISASGRGIKRSDEAKQRYSDANTGQKNSMFGKFGAQNARSRPVVGFPIVGGSPIRLESARGGEAIGFSQPGISHCCSGRTVTHKGYVWEYDVGPDTAPTKGFQRRFEPTRSDGGRFKKWDPVTQKQPAKLLP